MILTLTIVFLVLTVFLFVLGTKTYDGTTQETCLGCGIFSTIIFCGLLIAFLIMFGKTKKIELSNKQAIETIKLTTESQETEIKNSIELFMKQENMTYDPATLRNTDLSTLVSLNLYPTLTSNELIQTYFKQLNANKKLLLEYELEQTKISYYKWITYFGK